MEFLPERRRPYALAAFPDLEAVIMPDNAIGGTWYEIDYDFNLILDALVALIPEKAAQIHQMVFEKMNSALSRRNLRAIIGLDMKKHLLNVAPREALEWFEAAETIGRTNLMQLTKHEIDFLLSGLAPTKEKIMIESTGRHDHDVALSDVMRRVMLTPDNRDDQWSTSWSDELRRAWTDGLIVPQRLLREDNILWIGVGGRLAEHGSIGVHGCGLIQLDLTTGRVLSLRGGTMTGTSGNSQPLVGHNSTFGVHNLRLSPLPFVFDVPMLPIFRWHDKIVVPQGGVGILLYPDTPEKALGDLHSVEVVDERSGLVHTRFGQVVAFKDLLFILIVAINRNDEALLMQWDRHSKDAALLFNPHQENHPIRLSEQVPVGLQGIEIDNENRKLLLVAAGHYPRANQTGSDYRRSSWRYDWETGDWSKPPSPKESGSPEVKPKPESPVAWPDDEPMPFGFVNWKDGTLGITGYERDWKIEYFTRLAATATTVANDQTDHKHPEMADPAASVPDTQPSPSETLAAFLNSIIQKQRDAQPVTEAELQQTVEKFDYYCQDMIRKHKAGKNGNSLNSALQFIPPPDDTDIYLNWVRMALIHYPQYSMCLNPETSHLSTSLRPHIRSRLQSKFDPLYLLATIFSSISDDPGYAVRALETLREVDPYMARTAVKCSLDSRPCDAWMSEYYLKQGRDKDALRAAAMFGDIQTQFGIEIQAYVLEKCGDLAEAERLYHRIQQEFGYHGGLVGFYSRQRNNTDVTGVPYAQKLDALRDQYFPEGMRHVQLRDFREPPRAGVQFAVINERALRLGIKPADVIVAFDGIQVDTLPEYYFVRDLDVFNPQMTLILWNGNKYVEIDIELKNRQFQLPMEDYNP